MKEKKKKALSILAVSIACVSLLSFFVWDNREKFSDLYNSIVNKPSAQQNLDAAFEGGKPDSLEVTTSDKTEESADNSSENGVTYSDGETVSNSETAEGPEKSSVFPYKTSSCDWDYSILDIQLSDTPPDNTTFVDEDYAYYNEFLSDGEKLSDLFTYVVIDITIENCLDEGREYLLNSIGIVSLNENNEKVSIDGELLSFSDMYMKGTHRLHYEFKPKQSLTTKLVYLISKDKMKQYDTYIRINNLGYSSFTDDQRLIKIHSKSGD